MRFITTKVHGVLDYLTAVLLIAAPWLFGFADGKIDQWISVIIGLMIFMLSFLTDYELGFIKSIPMRIHLVIDMIVGLVLALSPWLFGFANDVYVPHLVAGGLGFVAGIVTKQEAYEIRIRRRRADYKI
jgi:hypothetical protein